MRKGAVPTKGWETAVAPHGRQMAAWRRDLHLHPELANQERGTRDLVLKALRSLGVTGRPVGTSTAVVALIAPKARGRVVALRADMDGLPVKETTGEPIAAAGGTMHACGHDVHMAGLLGAAAYLQEHASDLAGPVKLLFQPAEEEGNVGGAGPMIAAGALKSPRVDRVFGVHVDSRLPLATYGFRPGALMASPDHFTVRVTGRGGHAAFPHLGIDPVLLASEMIVGLQTLVSRSRDPLDPAVLTVGQIHGGSKDNIIPDDVVFEGTVRTLTPATRKIMADRFRTKLTSLAEAAGGKVAIDYRFGYPVTVNDPSTTESLESAFRTSFGEDRVRRLEHPVMGGEDFSRFLEEVPGTFLFVGTDDGGAGGRPLHTSSYFPPERALTAVAAAHVAAVHALQGGRRSGA